MTDRLQCCVPYCRRTRGQRKGEPPISSDEEWICGRHWPLVSYRTRAAYNLAKRRARHILKYKPHYRKFWELPPGAPERCSAVGIVARVGQAWEKCKREAIERAAGI